MAAAAEEADSVAAAAAVAAAATARRDSALVVLVSVISLASGRCLSRGGGARGALLVTHERRAPPKLPPRLHERDHLSCDILIWKLFY